MVITVEHTANILLLIAAEAQLCAFGIAVTDAVTYTTDIFAHCVAVDSKARGARNYGRHVADDTRTWRQVPVRKMQFLRASSRRIDSLPEFVLRVGPSVV